MNHQYLENGARNIYSNYSQMRVVFSALQINQKQLYLVDPSIGQPTEL